jgi:hypothetical protein
MCKRAAYWKQRGKCRAIREGDSNTRFFHARAGYRLRLNNISALEIDGVLFSSHDGKTRALTAHLHGLLGVAAPSVVAAVDVPALYIGAPTVDAAPSSRPSSNLKRAPRCATGTAPLARTASGRASTPRPGGLSRQTSWHWRELSTRGRRNSTA